jgi:tetratricopeptide (TPR) repeat protein
MQEDTGGVWGQFEELRSQGFEAVEDGRFEEAETCYRGALDLALALDEERYIDLATCNLAALAIQVGRGDGELPRLREILLRSSDPANCRLAAYHISVHYHYAKNAKKSAFYARVALDRARLLGRSDWLASCHNQLGNALLSESLVEEASREYEQALELISETPSPWRGSILNNLGYCRLLQGRLGDGHALLYESLRLLRRFRAQTYRVQVHLDLSFAHLETGRYRYAHRHGLAALALAERLGQTDAVKNALYLLGEAAHLSGDPQTARSYFDRLQRNFYPDATYLPGFLLAVDVRKLINLHA